MALPGSSPTLRVSGRGTPPSATALPRPALAALGRVQPPLGIVASSPTLRVLEKGSPPSAIIASIPRTRLYPARRSLSRSRTPASIPRASLYPARQPLIPRVGHPAPVNPRRARSHQRPRGPHMGHASRAQNPRPGTGGYRPFYHLMPIAHRLLLSLIRPAAARTKTRHCAPDQPRRKLFKFGKRIDRFR